MAPEVALVSRGAITPAPTDAHPPTPARPPTPAAVVATNLFCRRGGVVVVVVGVGGSCARLAQRDSDHLGQIDEATAAKPISIMVVCASRFRTTNKHVFSLSVCWRQLF